MPEKLLELLASCPLLEHLIVPSLSFESVSVSQLCSKLPNLRIFELSSPRARISENDAVTLLHECPQLEALDITVSASSRLLESLGSLRQMKQLRLHFSDSPAYFDPKTEFLHFLTLPATLTQLIILGIFPPHQILSQFLHRFHSLEAISVDHLHNDSLSLLANYIIQHGTLRQIFVTPVREERILFIRRGGRELCPVSMLKCTRSEFVNIFLHEATETEEELKLRKKSKASSSFLLCELSWL